MDTWTSRASRDRRFAIAVTIAFALHIPFAPFPLFVALRDRFFGHPDDYDDPPKPTVPIDLDLLARDPEPVAVEPPPAAPPPSAPTHEAPAEKAPPGPGPKAPTRPLDGGAPVPSSEPREAPRNALVDPLKAAGAAGKVSAKDPNVQVLIAGNVLRKHAIGAWASRMLVRIPEWKGFFQDSPLDPIRDFNHLLITAPRLWGDSSRMVAILDYNVSSDLARDAVDRVLRQTNGAWVDDAPVPAARAKIGGIPRLLAHLPDRKLLVILPADAEEQLKQLKTARGFKSSAEAVVVSLLNPWRPLRTFIALPDTLRWLRLAVVPAADGGLELKLEVGDASREDAAKHAPEITRLLEARRAEMGVEIFEPVTLVAEGDVLRGETRISGLRLAMLLAFAEGLAAPHPPR